MLTGRQYDKIKLIYEERRRNRDRLKLKRQTEVFGKLPGYRELDTAIRNLSINTALKSFDIEDEEERRQFTGATILRMRQMENEKKQLLLAAGYPEDYLDPPYECPDCKDTGYIGNEKCSCLRQLEIEQLYESLNMKAWLDGKSFDLADESYYEGEDLENFHYVLEVSHEMVDHFDEDHRGMVLYGNVGTGKTFMAGCIARALMEEGYLVLSFSASGLFEQISNAMYGSNKNELNSLNEMLYNCDLLVIDDLGTEYPNDFTKSCLFRIYNKRLDSGKPILITTNMSPSVLKDTYTERFASRLFSVDNRLCEMTGRDIRGLKALRTRMAELNGS